MRYNRFASLGLGLLLALSPGLARATTVQPPEFPALVDQADYVVRAVIKSSQSEWREKAGHRYIATKVTLEVREVIKGTPPATVVLDFLGGRVGDDELRVEGAPRLTVGEEDILFVQGNGTVFYPLVGVMHGFYPIFHDKASGSDYVVRSNGMPLYSEKDVALPMMQLSATKAVNAQAKPMTAAAFSTRIRAQVENRNQQKRLK
ncbi:MAG: hypothetical protein HYV95_13210 [Opitutae bacterium]|nr:hypothetical protein [Opitutae bacterium]